MITGSPAGPRRVSAPEQKPLTVVQHVQKLPLSAYQTASAWAPYIYPVLLALTALATIGFGVCGFWQEHCKCANGDPLMPAYRVLQLFVLNSGGEETQNKMGVMTGARLSAIAFVLLGSFGFIFKVAREMFFMPLRKVRRGHTVVCGLGRIGRQLVEDLHRYGESWKMVIIEKDEKSPWIDFVRERGADVIVGDATRRDILADAQVGSAARVFIVTGDDAANLETAAEASRLSKRQDATIHVHLADSQLADSFSAFCRDGDLGRKLRVFNVPRNAATHLIRDPRFLEHAPCKSDEVAHYFVIGFGPMGQTLAVQLALLGHFPNRKRARFTIADQNIDQLSREFLSAYNRFTYWTESREGDKDAFRAGVDDFHPEDDLWTCKERLLPPPLASEDKENTHAIDYVANAEFIELPADPGDERFAAKLAQRIKDPDIRVRPVILICSPHDRRNFDLALRLKDRLDCLDCKTVPFFVWLPTQPALAESLDALAESPDKSPRVFPFGRCDRASEIDEIENSSRELFARELQKAYETKQYPNDPSKRAPWESLSPAFKESNLQAADHLHVKLWTMGFQLQVDHRNAEKRTTFHFPKEREHEDGKRVVDVLGEMEHNRWMAERLLSGWRFALKPQRERKLHHQLVPNEYVEPGFRSIDTLQIETAVREAQRGRFFLKLVTADPCLKIIGPPESPASETSKNSESSRPS